MAGKDQPTSSRPSAKSGTSSQSKDSGTPFAKIQNPTRFTSALEFGFHLLSVGPPKREQAPASTVKATKPAVKDKGLPQYQSRAAQSLLAQGGTLASQLPPQTAPQGPTKRKHVDDSADGVEDLDYSEKEGDNGVRQVFGNVPRGTKLQKLDKQGAAKDTSATEQEKLRKVLPLGTGSCQMFLAWLAAILLQDLVSVQAKTDLNGTQLQRFKIAVQNFQFWFASESDNVQKLVRAAEATNFIRQQLTSKAAVLPMQLRSLDRLKDVLASMGATALHKGKLQVPSASRLSSKRALSIRITDAAHKDWDDFAKSIRNPGAFVKAYNAGLGLVLQGCNNANLLLLTEDVRTANQKLSTFVQDGCGDDARLLCTAAVQDHASAIKFEINSDLGDDMVIAHRASSLAKMVQALKSQEVTEVWQLAAFRTLKGHCTEISACLAFDSKWTRDSKRLENIWQPLQKVFIKTFQVKNPEKFELLTSAEIDEAIFAKLEVMQAQHSFGDLNVQGARAQF